jgi:hypothetical protein
VNSKFRFVRWQCEPTIIRRLDDDMNVLRMSVVPEYFRQLIRGVQSSGAIHMVRFSESLCTARCYMGDIETYKMRQRH